MQIFGKLKSLSVGKTTEFSDTAIDLREFCISLDCADFSNLEHFKLDLSQTHTDRHDLPDFLDLVLSKLALHTSLKSIVVEYYLTYYQEDKEIVRALLIKISESVFHTFGNTEVLFNGVPASSFRNASSQIQTWPLKGNSLSIGAAWWYD